jgi:hypothetical protein
MKFLHSVGRGAALGFLASVLGSVFSIIPTAMVVFTGPQAVTEPENTIMNIAMIIGLPLLNFFLHIIPVMLSGILVSYLWGKFFLSPLQKTLVACLAVLATTVFVVLMDPILFPSDIGEYERGLIDYVFVGGTGLSYITAFMLLAKKVLLPSGRNNQGAVE